MGSSSTQFKSLTQRLSSLTTSEWALLAVFAAGLLIALLNAALPAAIMVHSHTHAFADQRVLLGITNGMDVLSNAPYAVLGVLGWFYLLKTRTQSTQRLQRTQPKQGEITQKEASLSRTGLACLFTGLLLTAIGSSVYHLDPKQAWGLALDRAAISFAFAGLLAWASAHAVSRRSAAWVQWGVLASGFAAVLVWYVNGAFLPWLLVQFGGVLVLCVMAVLLLIKPSIVSLRETNSSNQTVGKILAFIVLMYLVSKLFEDCDLTVFELTQHRMSGHSLKHVISALAVLPLIRWLSQQPTDQFDSESSSKRSSKKQGFKVSKELAWVRQQTQNIQRQLKRSTRSTFKGNTYA